MLGCFIVGMCISLSGEFKVFIFGFEKFVSFFKRREFKILNWFLFRRFVVRGVFLYGVCSMSSFWILFFSLG